MLLFRKTEIKQKIKKSLSKSSDDIKDSFSGSIMRTKALQCARPKGSFTVEAAFVVPLFLFVMLLFLGLFQMMQVQICVSGGLQYAARTVAAACRDAEEEENPAILAGGKILFYKYLKEHDCPKRVIKNGIAGISFAGSDCSGDYVMLAASYRVHLPVSFRGIDTPYVQQCVRAKKWNGATENGGGEETGEFVYVTDTGRAYHSSSTCRYLDLSIRSVSRDGIAALRNKDGSIYYPCSCCLYGRDVVYITDYGVQYHENLSCSGLKRTVYRIRKREAGSRHPCSKCWKGG